jgi:hypothetical protein
MQMAAAVLVAVVGAGGHLLLNGGVKREASNSGGQVATATPAGVSPAQALPASDFSIVPASTSTMEVVPVRAEAPSVGGLVPAVAHNARSPASRPEVLDLPGGMVRVATGESVARIWVRRQGSLRGPATFFWWTEPGSAREVRDFAQILRRWEVIPDGAAGIELRVPLVRDSTRTQTRNFYVKIERGSSGAELGVRTIAQVEIVPRGPEAIAANITGLSN